MNNVYIYLVRRDKKDMKMIAILNGNCKLQRISKIENFIVSQKLAKEIESVIYDHRMQWEAWAEGANSIPDLINSLQKRNIKIPYKYNPLVKISDLEKNGTAISRKIK